MGTFTRWLAAVTCLALLAAAFAPVHGERLRGEDAREARNHLREVRRLWPSLHAAARREQLTLLARMPEQSVGKFLEELLTSEQHEAVLSGAAWALVRHGDSGDIRTLLRLHGRARTDAQRSACVRWLGLYGRDAPVADLRRIALGRDDSASAALYALWDAKPASLAEDVAEIGEKSANEAARRAAVGWLLEQGHERGLVMLRAVNNLEAASRLAHHAVGGALETAALGHVLRRVQDGTVLRDGERPHYFGSLLARLRLDASQRAVLDAESRIHRQLEPELRWWFISVNRAPLNWDVLKPFLVHDSREERIHGLRMIQRARPVFGEGQSEAADRILAELLVVNDAELLTHAVLACAATGIAPSELAERVTAWMASDDTEQRAAALLAAGHAKLTDQGPRAMELLEDPAWYVRSAALDALLHLRPTGAARAALTLARREEDGRLFSEAIALLCDLTGQDFGELLDRWGTWLDDHPEFEVRPRGRDSLRGVSVNTQRQRTAARFYGLELDSVNLQFVLDRSISMAMAVAREPRRPDFGSRKEDILRRRPEVNRLTRDGFLPRFYVAAAELSAALDVLNTRAMVGLTLFNHQFAAHPRVANVTEERRRLVNWMLSTEVQGATDIAGALLPVIGAAAADTIVLLSDGDPLSLEILEGIHRANVVKRLNIHAVSLHEQLSDRHYLEVLAWREAGQCVDAEPPDDGSVN
jgi:hypothetical protein